MAGCDSPIAAMAAQLTTRITCERFDLFRRWGMEKIEHPVLDQRVKFAVTGGDAQGLYERVCRWALLQEFVGWQGDIVFLVRRRDIATFKHLAAVYGCTVERFTQEGLGTA